MNSICFHQSRPFKVLKVTLLLLVVMVFSTTGLGCKVKGQKKTPKPGDKIYPVSLSAASLEEIPDILEIKGTFVPSDQLDVKSEVEGKVAAVPANEGQQVSAGEALASINPEQLNLLLERQRLELKEAEARIEAGIPVKGPAPVFRNGMLGARRPDAAPSETPPAETPAPPGETPETPPRPTNLEEVGEGPPPSAPVFSAPVAVEKPEAVIRAEEAAVDRIKADIALTEKKIEAANISAGISGFITKKNITDGSVVNPGETLFQITRIDPILLSIFVPKESVGNIKLQDKFDVTANEVPDQTVTGEVVAIAAEPDPQNKNYEIKISIPNTQLKIKGGMAGSVVMPLGQLRKGMLIPADAVIAKDNKNYVYVVSDQVAERKEVDLGKKVGEKVEVKKGLKIGDKVVFKGQATFNDPEEFVNVESL